MFQRPFKTQVFTPGKQVDQQVVFSDLRVMFGAKHFPDARRFGGIVEIPHDDDFGLRNDGDNGIHLSPDDAGGAVASLNRLQLSPIFRWPVVDKTMKGVAPIVEKLGIYDVT